MADRTITAEAVISAKDATGDAFASIAKKMQGVAKQAQSSLQMEGLTKNLKQAEQHLKAMENLQKSRVGVTNSRNEFRERQTALEAMARTMRGMEAPSKAIQSQFKQMQTGVSQASAALQKQAAGFKEARAALEGYGTPLAKVASEQVRVRASIESTTKAIERQIGVDHRAAAAEAELQAKRTAAHKAAERMQEQRRHAIAHHGIVNYALGAAAGYANAHGVVTEIERTVHAGAELQHERTGLLNAGRTPQEVAAIERRSREVVGRVPTASTIENMKVVAETTPAFGSVEHALEHLEFMQKTISVLKASGGEHIKGNAGEVGRALAKTFEERFTKAENFEKEASAMIPAMVASGGVFNPEQLYAFAQQAKGSLPNYNMRFLSRIAPSIIGAMGGDRAGTAANAFTSIIMGKVNDKKQAEEWERYGLLDEKQVIKKSGNVVSWRAGAVKNTELALSDPLAWAEQVALPAMLAKGVKVGERMPLAIALGTMFRNQNGNMFANEIMQADSRSRLHKDEALTNRVGSTDDIYHRNLERDSTVAITALTASITNLRSSVAGPIVGAASPVLLGVATAINRLSDLAAAHPVIAASTGSAAAGGALIASGVLSYKLATAGSSLQTAAIMLQGAARQQGWKSGVPAVVGGGGAAAEAAGVVGSGAVGFAAGLGFLGTIAGAAWLIKTANATQRAGGGGAYAPATYATRSDDEDA